MIVILCKMSAALLLWKTITDDDAVLHYDYEQRLTATSAGNGIVVV
jgi:hypothetical protein